MRARLSWVGKTISKQDAGFTKIFFLWVNQHLLFWKVSINFDPGDFWSDEKSIFVEQPNARLCDVSLTSVKRRKIKYKWNSVRNKVENALQSIQMLYSPGIRIRRFAQTRRTEKRPWRWWCVHKKLFSSRRSRRQTRINRQNFNVHGNVKKMFKWKMTRAKLISNGECKWTMSELTRR